MNIDRTTVLSVALTVILVTSMFPASIVGTADATPHRPNSYTVIQGTNCWEVNPYHPGDPNPEGPPGDRTIKPHVEVVDHSHELGSFRNSSWDGTPTIESVMAYRYRDPAGGVHDNDQAWGQRPYYAPQLAEQYWKEPWSFGTYGLWNWSENQESHMFFYNGPEGDSIVMRHDKLYDNTPIGSHNPYNGRNGPGDGFMSPQPGGGAATFIFRDLPAGEWAYMDDLYPEGMDAIYYDSGEFDYDPNSHTRYGTRHNNYTFENSPDDAAPIENYGGGTDFTAHWKWNGNGTDGGAYRGLENLGPGESMVIEPYFDEESYFWSNHPWWYDRSEGDGITDWVIRRKNGENIRLDKTEPVEIRRGSHCPTAQFSFDTASNSASVEVGEEFALDGRASDGSNLQYYWDLDGDGQFEDNATSAVLSHAYDGSVGDSVSVTLMVEDPDGLQNTLTREIEVVPAEQPDASVSISGTNQNSLDEYHVPDETLTFDATNSTDNVALNASSAVWRVDGDVVAEGRMQYSQAFGETGDYEVSFTVSDEAGHNTTETMTVSVDSLDTRGPEANAEVTPREVEAGANVTFDASGTDDNRGIQTYRWDVDGDGSFEETTSDPTFTHVYGSQNTYNVTLEVEDGNQNIDNVTVPVTVMERESPNITEWSYPSQIAAGDEVEFSASANDNGRVAEYRWAINGEVVTGNPATYVFDQEISSNQTISVRLVVVDEAGEATGTSTETITVQPRDDEPANASLSVSTDQTRVGNDVTFDASESTDNRGISAYHWDFDGDGSPDRTTENPVVTHSYSSADTYNATVMVDDGSDSSANGTATVQIGVEQEQQAQQDSSSSSSVSTGPPPVDTEVEESGPNAAAIDVQNGQADKTIEADLPENDVASETGVSFEQVSVDLDSDDPHVIFETAASADPPESVTELDAADETLAYLELDAKYLDDGVENATVEFTVSESALGGLAESSDVMVYQYTDSWEQVDAEVVETTEDGYRLTATTDELGTLAVGTDQPLSVAVAGLASDTVTAGETVTATATVENTGTDARSGTVTLTLDGNVVASETVEVAPGETEEVTLNGTAPTTGTYEATVAGVSAGTLTVEERQPADVSVADVSLNASTIEAGEQVEITATVENTGDEAGEQTVTLTLFGEELDSKTVEVPGGETKEITFVRQIDAAGTYTVDVNGETAEIEVTDDSNDDLGDQAPDVPGFGVGAALAALLAVALLARLRN
jgi:PGF-CTERM protein